MEQRNNVTEFFLLGLTQSPQGQKIQFVIFLLIYIVTIVLTVVVSPTLHAHMYFFLGNLSFMDAVYSTTFTPNMIINLLYEKRTISFQACMTQIFTGHLFGGAEILLLVFMAYDCYVDICKPLHYLTIMNQRVCVLLLLLAWAGGFLHAVLHPLFVYKLPFCGPNVMDHFVCDMYPLLKLACTDTQFIALTVLANDRAICMAIFTLLLISYGVILRSLENRNQEGRHKALSTCGSHITVVVLFFVPCVFMFVRPLSTLPIDKYLTVFYTIITPMLNPLIYTLRNGEMKNAMKKLWNRESRVLFLGLALLHVGIRRPLEWVKAQCAFSRGASARARKLTDISPKDRFIGDQQKLQFEACNHGGKCAITPERKAEQCFHGREREVEREASTEMKEDRTTVAEFILMGLTQNPLLQRDLFLLLLIPYIVTVVGNVLTVVTTIGSQTLDSLMCFFLAFLFLMDPGYSSSIVLKMPIESLSG
ncbi:olfactory receptor 4A47-like [Muntiacus reevesi]|uniref:olfactory receptor 4A47-like n=1 Tax=Muntiacus reevesi TaxID=9886 RepID=UPI0033071D3D